MVVTFLILNSFFVTLVNNACLYLLVGIFLTINGLINHYCHLAEVILQWINTTGKISGFEGMLSVPLAGSSPWFPSPPQVSNKPETCFVNPPLLVPDPKRQTRMSVSQYLRVFSEFTVMYTLNPLSVFSSQWTYLMKKWVSGITVIPVKLRRLRGN